MNSATTTFALPTANADVADEPKGGYGYDGKDFRTFENPEPNGLSQESHSTPVSAETRRTREPADST